MNYRLIICGVLIVLVGLGFVFPQLANLRSEGVLLTGQVLLLGLGVGLTIAGVTGVIFGGNTARRVS